MFNEVGDVRNSEEEKKYSKVFSQNESHAIGFKYERQMNFHHQKNEAMKKSFEKFFGF